MRTTTVLPGKTFACAFIAVSFFTDQLDTPIDFALPAACSASIAAHVSSMVGDSAGPCPRWSARAHCQRSAPTRWLMVRTPQSARTVQFVTTGQWMR